MDKKGMDKKNKARKKKKRLKIPLAGSSPGVVYIDENSLKPVITLHKINETTYETRELPDINQISQLLADKNFTFWIEIKGFSSPELFETLNRELHVNRLILEDITRSYQRPKLEEYDDYVFAVSRMLLLDDDKNLENEQLSFILTDNGLITLQENYSVFRSVL
ncbi:CorA family divalent cation transporter [Pedobacter sp. NJ-S-72]